MRKRALWLTIVVLSSAARAGAEPIVVTTASFSTQGGGFGCLQDLRCTVEAPNSITIFSGEASTTITFTGVNVTHAVRNVVDRVPLGTFTATATSPSFTFPTGSNPNIAMLQFGFGIVFTAPVSMETSLGWRFGPGGGTTVPFIGPTYFVVPTGPLGPGLDYSSIVYTVAPWPLDLPSNGTLEIFADVGAIPEPTTLALAGAGLVGVYLRRRRAGRASARC